MHATIACYELVSKLSPLSCSLNLFFVFTVSLKVSPVTTLIPKAVQIQSQIFSQTHFLQPWLIEQGGQNPYGKNSCLAHWTALENMKENMHFRILTVF